MRIIITENVVNEWAAYYVAKCILDQNKIKNPFVLALPLRHVEKSFYDKIVSFHDDDILSFDNVHIVSSGEYIGKTYSQDYLNNIFLSRIKIPKENIHLFDSEARNRKLESRRMAEIIEGLGGITLLIDSLGEDATFILNTPLSSLDAGIRDKKVSDIIASFESEKLDISLNDFPKEGYTLGFREAYNAKYLLLMAKGYKVSHALSQVVENPISHFYPASALQMHKKLIIVADEDAVSELKVKTYKYSKTLEDKSLHPKELIKGLYKSYYALTNCRIFDGEKFILGHSIIIENNRIKSIEKEIDVDVVISRIDLGGKTVASGYIDLQLNGCGCYDINSTPTLETLQGMNETNHKYGCTSYLPTIITTTDENMLKLIDLFNHIEDLSIVGALGIHFEGPYISLERSGIHEKKNIRKPSKEMIDRIIASKCVMVTVAPEEVDGEVIRKLSQNNIVVSMGHTNGTYAEIKEKIPYGLTFATHLFNTMRPWGPREPGAVGAVLENKDIYAGIIADGLHCDFASLELAYKLKTGRLCIVTDAIPPAATDVDKFIWAGKEIYRDGDKYVDENGTLAGSSIVMSQSVRNVVNMIGASVEEALRMASLYPAEAMGIDDKYGRVEAGYIADLVILDDKLVVKGIIVKGSYKEMNYDREDFH